MNCILYLGLFLFAYLPTIHCTLVTDDAEISAAKAEFEEVMRTREGRYPNPETKLVSDGAGTLGDMVFAAQGIFYCDQCFKYENSSNNFLIKLDPVTQFELTLHIDEAPSAFLIKVMDGTTEGYSVVDAHVNESKTYMFRSTAGAMHIHLDGRLFPLIFLKFGFHVKSLSTEYNGPTGCYNTYTGRTYIPLPHGMNFTDQHGDCYWKVDNSGNPVNLTLPSCVAGDEENCYLKFLRIYEGEGEAKRCLNPDGELTTVYLIPSGKAVLEYFGCPLKTAADIWII